MNVKQVCLHSADALSNVLSVEVEVASPSLVTVLAAAIFYNGLKKRSSFSHVSPLLFLLKNKFIIGTLLLRDRSFVIQGAALVKMKT